MPQARADSTRSVRTPPYGTSPCSTPSPHDSTRRHPAGPRPGLTVQTTHGVAALELAAFSVAMERRPTCRRPLTRRLGGPETAHAVAVLATASPGPATVGLIAMGLGLPALFPITLHATSGQADPRDPSWLTSPLSARRASSPARRPSAARRDHQPARRTAAAVRPVPARGTAGRPPRQCGDHIGSPPLRTRGRFVLNALRDHDGIGTLEPSGANGPLNAPQTDAAAAARRALHGGACPPV
jgi:hypothetical protein